MSRQDIATQQYLTQGTFVRLPSSPVEPAPHGQKDIQNVNDVLCQVDDQGNVTPLIGGVAGGITAITGDVVATGPGVVASVIQNAAVTYAKIQNVAANSFLGNASGSPSAMTEISAATAKTMLSLAAIATSGSAADLVSGTLPAARFPALTGDLTTVAGTLAATLALTAQRIAFGSGSNTLGQSANFTYDGIKQIVTNGGDGAGGSGEFLRLVNTDPTQFFAREQISSYNVLSGVSTISSAIQMGSDFRIITLGANSGAFQVRGTNSTNPAAGTHYLYVDTIAGDTLLGVGNVPTSSTGGFLHVTSCAGIPTGVPSYNLSSNGIALIVDKTNSRLYGYLGGAWHFTPFNDGASSGITELTGDIAAGPGTGIVSSTINNNVVTLAKMATIATTSLLGRSTAGTGNVEVITVGSGLTLSGGTLSSSSSGGTITALTGDVTASGSGSVVATIANDAVTTVKILNANVTTAKIANLAVTTGLLAANAVTYAKLQTQADQTILGNVSGGVAVPSALTGSQVEAILFGGLASGVLSVTATTGVVSSTALTATRVMFASGANSIGSDSNFTYDSTNHVLQTPTANINLVEGFGGGNTLTLQESSGATTVLSLVSGASATLKGTLAPTATTTYALGSSSKLWTALFASTANVDTVQSIGGGSVLTLNNAASPSTIISMSASNINVTGTVKPSVDDTYDLGTTAATWGVCYATVVNGKAHGLGLISDANINIAPQTGGNITLDATAGSGNVIIEASGNVTIGVTNILSNVGGVGFLGATAHGPQTGGSATAGAVYTATEQTMLQRAYDCLRTFGFLN